LKSGTLFADCQKWHFSISFSEEMVGLFDFLFVRRSLLGVRPPQNIKKSDIKIFGLVPYRGQNPPTLKLSQFSLHSTVPTQTFEPGKICHKFNMWNYFPVGGLFGGQHIQGSLFEITQKYSSA